MKKFISILLIIMCIFGFVSCGFLEEDSASSNQKAVHEKNKEEVFSTSIKAMSAVPTPEITNFVERKTLAEWAERWDKPSVVTYVYLFSYGNCIGYYVCNGKPAATTNYLIPEYQVNTSLYGSNGGGYAPYEEQTMDLDGTYGANNPGIRFFTASGIAVEWAGSGASYLYSDEILPLNVTCLGK